ncbi:carboxypeptidase-like regulatory domain-containing protein [Hymenobacter cellulosivorans]|uniref:Carboxypeptidase-like regulatory domain-containing protein n=1 Tax=Hymenobacter cellulosivorans TaxID=2932249 RepID=A0ABY4FD24_9BACT|nr:carboxypeptidase-like regulatory domain-containing protein [Hymenobacter cellulosivorans]UOQ53928.1 carboxypeptidase-like regulatory domain-containing protein [Hymenobacter cellulosivorans]
MALTAYPFHPVTGELLPTYRDAYLRGDLSGKNADLVDAYLKANPNEGDEALKRFYALREKGHNVRPVGWLQHQFHLMRTEPVRFRRRAGSIVLVGALLSGAVLAGTNLPSADRIAVPASTIAAASEEMVAVATEAAATKKMAVVSGRILDENGRPLVGATVLDKISGRGVTTNAQGTYSMLVPANQTSKLQFGYGGYTEDEVQVKGRSVQNMTLLPRTDAVAKVAKRHWWQF